MAHLKHCHCISYTLQEVLSTILIGKFFPRVGKPANMTLRKCHASKTEFRNISRCFPMHACFSLNTSRFDTETWKIHGFLIPTWPLISERQRERIPMKSERNRIFSFYLLSTTHLPWNNPIFHELMAAQWTELVTGKLRHQRCTRFNLPALGFHVKN